MKTYTEKLRDPRWQKKRLEIMERDEFACVLCTNSESTLNVHHCYYGKGKDPWDYENEHLITVCEACHAYVEHQRDEILKTMTWEIPIDAIHTLATCGDPFFLSEVSSLFRGAVTKRALEARVRRVRSAISFMESVANEMENQAGNMEAEAEEA